MQRTAAGTLTVLGLFALVSGIGCGESVDSSDVATSGIYADFRARATGDGNTQVDLQFKVGGATSNTTLELQEGDEVEVTSGGQEYGVQKRNAPVGDKTRYRAVVHEDSVGTEIKVSLTRRDYEDAPNSTTTMPKPFSIQGPKSNAKISRASDLTVELSNASEDSDQSLTIRGDCIKTHMEQFDGSEVTIPKGNIEKREPDPDEDSVPDSCNASISVSRGKSGAPDSAYGEGGSFPALQDRSRSFTTKK